MTLASLQSAWRAELEKGSSSALAGSPAFKEALIGRKEGFQKPGWHEVGPQFPKVRSTGTKALGKAYEKRVGEFLLGQASALGWSFMNHPWLLTRNGSWLQPDFLLIAPSGKGLLFEVKLTYVEEGWGQLARYKKAIWETVGMDVVGCLVCKNLTAGAPKAVGEFEEVAGGTVWHAPVL
jgi:hypothetical protein